MKYEKITVSVDERGKLRAHIAGLDVSDTLMLTELTSAQATTIGLIVHIEASALSGKFHAGMSNDGRTCYITRIA